MDNFLVNFNFKHIDSAATNLLICPDQYVSIYNLGQAVQTRTYDSISYNYDTKGSPICANKRQNTIAIILESPHADEYEFVNGVLVPNGPLCGKWNDFASLFDSAIKSSILNSLIQNSITYNIAFVNAVQYQCSLGKPLSGKNSYQNQKNKNVINCWYQGFNLDLKQRLIALNPTIIINLSGKNASICNQITNMISNPNNGLKAIPYTIGIHPSVWRCKKNSSKLIE